MGEMTMNENEQGTNGSDKKYNRWTLGLLVLLVGICIFLCIKNSQLREDLEDSIGKVNSLQASLSDFRWDYENDIDAMSRRISSLEKTVVEFKYSDIASKSAPIGVYRSDSVLDTALYLAPYIESYQYTVDFTDAGNVASGFAIDLSVIVDETAGPHAQWGLLTFRNKYGEIVQMNSYEEYHEDVTIFHFRIESDCHPDIVKNTPYLDLSYNSNEYRYELPMDDAHIAHPIDFSRSKIRIVSDNREQRTILSGTIHDPLKKGWVDEGKIVVMSKDNKVLKTLVFTSEETHWEIPDTEIAFMYAEDLVDLKVYAEVTYHNGYRFYTEQIPVEYGPAGGTLTQKPFGSVWRLTDKLGNALFN